MTGVLSLLPDAWRMARRRVSALIAVALAVLGGSILITGTGILADSGLSSSAPVGALGAADIVVSGSQLVPRSEDLPVPLTERSGVPPEISTRLESHAQVVEVVGRTSVHVVPLTSSGEPLPVPLPAELGANWSFSTLGSPSLDGEAPAARDQIAVSRELASELGLAVGDAQSLLVAGEEERFEVTAVTETPGASVFFADPVAEELAGHPHRVDLFGLSLAPGVDSEQALAALETELAGEGLELSTGPGRGDAAVVGAASSRGQLIGIAASLGGTLLLTVGFIVSAAVGVSVTQQRREMALLRAIGATPRQVRRLVALQTLMPAVVALVVGILGGYLLAGWAAARLESADLLPSTVQIVLGPLPGLATAVLMLAAVVIAALAGASRTSRLAATEAIAESRVEPRPTSSTRTTVGAALIAFSLASSVFPLFAQGEAAVASTASMVLVGSIGLALAGPAIVRHVTGALAARSEGSAVMRWLAAHNSRSYAQRTAGAVTVLALAIALAVMQLFVTTTLGAAQRADLEAGDRMTATVAAADVGGLSESARSRLAGSEGVSDAVGAISTTFLLATEPVGEAGAEPLVTTAYSANPAPVVDLDVARGELAALHDDAVAMEAGLASFHRFEIGDRVPLITDDGRRVEPILVATYERGFGYGALIVGTDLLHGPTGGRLYDMIHANGDPAAIQDWATAQRGAEVQSPEARADRGGEGTLQGVNLALTLVLLGYVVMGGANNLVSATSRRASELGLLRRLGATPRQVASMMRREALVTSGMAAAAGLALSLPGVTLLGMGLLGRPWPQGPVWAIPLIVAVAIAVAYPAIMVPTRRILRRGTTTLLP